MRATASGGVIVADALRVAFQIARGQFERRATARTLQCNARRHETDGAVEKAHCTHGFAMRHNRKGRWRPRCYDEVNTDGAEHFVRDGRETNTVTTIPAKYENGVFRPFDAVQIKEGTVVEVYVPGDSQTPGQRPRSVRDFAFCGMWKDREEMADSAAYVNRLRGDLRR